MKQKIFILLLVIFLLPGLAACLSQNPTDGQTFETIGEGESEDSTRSPLQRMPPLFFRMQPLSAILHSPVLT